MLKEAVEKERRAKQAESLRQTHETGVFGAINCPKQSQDTGVYVNLLTQTPERVTTKLAETFSGEDFRTPNS